MDETKSRDLPVLLVSPPDRTALNWPGPRDFKGAAEQSRRGAAQTKGLFTGTFGSSLAQSRSGGNDADAITSEAGALATRHRQPTLAEVHSLLSPIGQMWNLRLSYNIRPTTPIDVIQPRLPSLPHPIVGVAGERGADVHPGLKKPSAH